MRNFLNSRHTNYNEIGDKVDSFCEDCKKKWFPFSFLWWDDNKKNIADIKRKDNGVLVIDKILSLINSILSSIKDIYERIDVIEPPIIAEDTVELKNTYLEVGVTDEDFQEDLNIALYEKYIYLDENKVDKPLIESTTDNIKIVALNEQGESVYVTSNSVGRVKSVNGKEGHVILKTSDLQNDSDFTTNNKLNKEIQDRISADNLKLDKPTTTGDINEYPNIVVVDNLGNSAKVKASEFGKVKSVNGKIGDVVLKTSDLQNDSDYTTNALLNKKLDKPTTNNTNQFVILGDGSTAPKSDFGKVDTVMGVAPDVNKNVDISNVPMNWTNPSQRWSALPNKTGDVEYNKVMVLDSEGKAGTKDAGDLGKNFANTNLVVSENRKHTGIASLELAMPMIYSNASQRFPGLVDKSADATYNVLLGMDNQGNAGKLTALGNVLESGLQTISSAQALRIGQLLNGGVGSSGMMSVNMISPPYIKLADEDTYVVLRGANLYLQVDNYRIDITNVNGDILANIPNSQIQLRDSGTELVFYYNFTTLGQGKYKLKLTSGSKILQTTLSFEVVQNMETVNLNSLTWEVLEKNENQDSASVISPTTITLNRLVNDTTTYLPIISAKSSPIFQAHEDWMLEFEVTFRMNLVPGQQGLSKSIAGVDYEAVQHTLIQSGVAYIYWNKPGSANHISRANYFESPNSLIGFTEGSGNSSSLHNHIRTLNVILVKTGNMITVNSNGYTSTNVVTNGEAYCFLAQISGRQATNSESMSVKLLTAYKF